MSQGEESFQERSDGWRLAVGRAFRGTSGDVLPVAFRNIKCQLGNYARRSESAQKLRIGENRSIARQYLSQCFPYCIGCWRRQHFGACRALDGDHTLGSVRQHTCCMAVGVKSERSAERRGPMRQFADGPWALLCTLCPSGSGRANCHSERVATFQRPGPFTRVSELPSSAVGG